MPASEKQKASTENTRGPSAVAAGDRKISIGRLDPEFCMLAARRAMEARQFPVARRLLREYVQHIRDDAKAHLSLAMCLTHLGEYAEACAALEEAWRLRPDHIRTNVLLGNMLHATGRTEEGRRAYLRALQREPVGEHATFTAAIARLLHGDYERGWRDLEARWRVEHVPSLPFRPSGEYELWDGSPARRRTLCIHNEGGHGDAIMFSRFIPAIAERFERVLLVVPPAIARLLSTIPGVAEVVPVGQSPPEGSLHTSVWSLPHHAGARLESIPHPDGYLTAPSDGPRLGNQAGFRVGVAWAGNPNSTYDRDRSMPSAELLRPLLDLTDIEWISLQVGHRASEAESLPISPVPALEDFAQTAALLRQLDLVITVDTAIGHLAGALGVPVWIILPSIPEYRWLLDRDDTPWYRSARLFRREHTNDWEGVIGRVQAELGRQTGRSGTVTS